MNSTVNRMNETIETILKRRSVRRFSSLQVRGEDIETILQCALHAPSGHNLQSPRFVVMQDEETLAALNRIIQRELASRTLVPNTVMYSGILRARQEGYHFCYRAPALISAIAPRENQNAMADCACALENGMLAATALGLGSCWSNQPHWLTDVPALRALFARYGMREDEDIFGSVAIGYADGPLPAPPTRKTTAPLWRLTA